MNQEKMSRVLRVLEGHAGEEHLLDSWLKIINGELKKNHQIKSTKALAHFFSRLRRLGLGIVKREISVGSNAVYIKTAFYKYK